MVLFLVRCGLRLKQEEANPVFIETVWLKLLNQKSEIIIACNGRDRSLEIKIENGTVRSR